MTRDLAVFRLQLSSGCWVVVACPGGSPQSVQTPQWHVSHRRPASAGSPSPCRSSPKEWRKVVFPPGGLAVFYASPPAWCLAPQRERETEPRRSEGPELGSHSSAGCHSGKQWWYGQMFTTVDNPLNALLSQFMLGQYLQRPQCDIHVSINAICTEHGLVRPSGEGQHGFLVLCRKTNLNKPKTHTTSNANLLIWSLTLKMPWLYLFSWE